MNDSALKAPRGKDAGMMRGFWYPALGSDQIHGRKLQPAMLLGIPLVLGRESNGRPFALRDNCPHRGVPLSGCRFDGEFLECPYHGWRFEANTGRCREIPALPTGSDFKADRIAATRFPCEEQDSYVWVYIQDPDRPQEPLPPVPRLPVFGERYRFGRISAEQPLSFDNGVVHLMDPAHGPFVHQSWWWRSRASMHDKAKLFAPIPNGFSMRAHQPSANSRAYKLLGVYGEPITTQIDFVLPNMRFEQVRCGAHWFSSRATVTPVTADRCRVDVCAAWNIFPLLPFMPSIIQFFGRKFLGQDMGVMAEQARGLKSNPTFTLIDDADRLAKWYYQLKAAYLESRRTGQPMQHPIPGPVTLRWRS